MKLTPHNIGVWMVLGPLGLMILYGLYELVTAAPVLGFILGWFVAAWYLIVFHES